MSDTRKGPAAAAETWRRTRRVRVLLSAGGAALVALTLGFEIPHADVVLAACCAALVLLVHRSGGAGVRGAAGDREQALSLLQATLESTADALLVVDTSGRIVSYNGQFLEMWAVGEEALRSELGLGALMPLLDRLVDPDVMLARMCHIMATPEAESRDELAMADGRVVERHSRPQRVGSQVVGRVWSFRDVTDERRALASLRRREEQLAEAQRLARLGNWEWNLVTQEVAVSEEVWRVLGLPGSAVGTLDRFLGYVHADDKEVIGRLNERAIRTGEPYACDLRAIGEGGRELSIGVRARVQVNGAGVPIRLIGTLQDVTERREAAAALERRDAILEAISFAAERFLRSCAWDHDLKGALERIGAAAGASRAYLFERVCDVAGAVLVSQREEWAADGITSQIRNPALQNVRLADLGLERWERMLQRNEHVQEIVAELAEEERVHLVDQEIQSILLIPISVGGEWWGFLGFDDCLRPRQWSTAEREVLAAAAGMIGAAIERKRNEEALRESELRFKQLSDNIPEVFFMAAADMSELLYLSPSFERIWERSLAEARANPTIFLESILPEDRGALVADMELSRTGRGREHRQLDFRIRRPEGAIRWIRTRVFQIPDSEGNPYRVAGVCTDVTAHKQMEEELRRANRIEAIGHLAAGIAHEINTPIQYIGDNVRFLDESYADLRSAMEAFRALVAEASAGPMDPRRLAEIAAQIRLVDIDYLIEEAPRATAQAMEGVRRVAEIVRAMKEFAHPGTGQKVPTDLNQAIRSTTTVARNEWRYVAELVTNLDPALPPVHCLAGEVNQAILNLVVNAAHAIADRQALEGTRTPGEIVVATADRGEHVEISVSDTGTGIPVEIRQRIFDPFFTTKEVGRGTGQGLTFVHSTVVDKHGGTITFESEPGRGTTFIVRLPYGSAVTGLEEAA